MAYCKTDENLDKWNGSKRKKASSKWISQSNIKNLNPLKAQGSAVNFTLNTKGRIIAITRTIQKGNYVTLTRKRASTKWKTFILLQGY